MQVKKQRTSEVKNLWIKELKNYNLLEFRSKEAKKLKTLQI